MKRLTALASLLPAAALGQINLNFQQGASGQTPTGWFVVDSARNAGYTASLRSEACRVSLPCAVLSSVNTPGPEAFGTMLQTFDAAPFRGKKVRFRAWVKLERIESGDRAQLLLRVGRPDYQQGFLDNMADRPIVSGEWHRYDLQGEVASDARDVQIGVIAYGRGRAWIGDADFGPISEESAGPAVDTAREAIRKVYARMDAAFARGDVTEIAAIVMPDAQMGVGTIREPLLPAIESEVRKGSQLTARTEIASVRLSGDEAVVMVRRQAQDPLSDGKRRVVTSHRDTWIQTANGWRWRESIEISYHWILPPTTAESARPVIAELKKRAMPLVAGDNLSSLGTTVGDARVVALGEAARGTREFQQWKQRLVEYLAKEKGFTALAATDETEVHDLVERLHLKYFHFDGMNVDGTEKTIVWADNLQVAAAPLRNKLGKKLYVLGFGFRRGGVRAIGIENGDTHGVGNYTALPSPEGTGDAILGAAGMPQYFLNVAAVPRSSALGRWIASLHLFHNLGAYWILDDPDASLRPGQLSEMYDGLIFVEQVSTAI